MVAYYIINVLYSFERGCQLEYNYYYLLAVLTSTSIAKIKLLSKYTYSILTSLEATILNQLVNNGLPTELSFVLCSMRTLLCMLCKLNVFGLVKATITDRVRKSAEIIGAAS